MTYPEKKSGKQQGLSKEAWAAISAIVVALIGGIATVFTTIYKSSPSPSPSTSAPTSSTARQKVAEIPIGKWSGMAKDPSGTSFPINIEINRDCSLNTKCGYISVPEVPCYGEISFINPNNDYYEFDVSNFDTRSDLTACEPGAGELFRLLPDGRLTYKATYSNAEGVLEKVGDSR
jgi:hypothetical protein